ncbi:ROK family protein [Bacteroides thetaiotaomicron]|uniref:ROK family protein n=1 Tax=Bacteroides thetaiotaomicron TaxID=818 RepID=UPI0034A3AC58
MKYYLGIDIGGTHIKGGIVNLLTNDIHQNILSHEELNATDSTSSIITKVRKVITDIQACMPLSKLGGIGIAMPGPCDYAKGIVAIYGVPKFQSLFGLNLKEEIKKVSDLNTVFINDASAYALGEYYAGAAKDTSRSIIVTIGTGLGSTFLENDTVLNELTEGIPEHGYLYNIPYRDGMADDFFFDKMVCKYMEYAISR